jgi:hypothetical protein
MSDDQDWVKSSAIRRGWVCLDFMSGSTAINPA